jgi:hypothetical protein
MAILSKIKYWELVLYFFTARKTHANENRSRQVLQQYFIKDIKHEYATYFADTLDGKFYKSCGRKYFISTLMVYQTKNWYISIHFLLTDFTARLEQSEINLLQHEYETFELRFIR